MITRKVPRTKPLQAGHDPACEREETPAAAPDAGLHAANGNVYPDGGCTMPAHAEAARSDTGEPCVDGRNWPEMEKKSNGK